MARKQTKVSNRMLFSWLLLVGLILLFSPQHLTSKLQFSFDNLFSGPLKIGRNIPLSAQTPITRNPSSDRIAHENHIHNLEQQLRQAYKRIDELAGLRVELPFEKVKFLPAAVIRDSVGSSQGQNVKIDCGLDDNVSEGQFAIFENSVIGIVSAVSTNVAQVQLVTDTNSKLAVNIVPKDSLNQAEISIPAILCGIGQNQAKINLISTKKKIGKGDFVFAATKPGFLPSPIIIGTIVSCKKSKDNPLFWDITVEPNWKMENLMDIHILMVNI